MKLATLQTEDGVRVVGVQGGTTLPKYVDLTTTDERIGRSLKRLLASDSGLQIARDAAGRGDRGGKIRGGDAARPDSPPR
ncbi:MAG: hypothetical protein R3B90_19370 [Planctomycetaceae bacterium]